MSLIPYNDDSVIMKDSHSNSLVIVNPQKGKLSVFERVKTTNNSTNFNFDINTDSNIANGNFRNSSENHLSSTAFKNDDDLRRHSISIYTCPVCGTQIDNGVDINDGNKFDNSHMDDKPNRSRNTSNNDSTKTFQFPYNFPLNEKYFQFLEKTFKRHIITENILKLKDSSIESFIPIDLFTPGYFHKFFTVLSLLGNGARGSVFKVIHKIGETELGIFALKKISIGNDMIWFDKCIREVKALSSITHKSNNLITYNHVWLEMDKSYGVTDNINDKDNIIIPCLFILQQYCPGGNLEDCILVEVFKKFPEKISKDRRKILFKQRRKNKMDNVKIKLGLNSFQILHIIRDLARGLHELHDLNIIHRDLKPSNCLLLSNYKQEDFNSTSNESSESNSEVDSHFFPTIVIGDLGESQIVGELRSATGCTGTLEYTAPEIIINDNKKEKTYNEFSFASDMYSLGMIIYFTIFGSLPFIPDPDIDDLKRTVKKFNFNKEEMIERHKSLDLNPIDSRIFDLVESLVNTNPDERPTASVIEMYTDKLLVSLNDENSFIYNNTAHDVDSHKNRKNATFIPDEIDEENTDFNIHDRKYDTNNFDDINRIDESNYSTNLISPLNSKKKVLTLTNPDFKNNIFLTDFRNKFKIYLIIIAIIIFFISLLHLWSLMDVFRYLIIFLMGYFFSSYIQGFK